MICQFYQSCSASSQSPATFLEPSVLVLAQEWLVFSFFFNRYLLVALLKVSKPSSVQHFCLYSLEQCSIKYVL